jgi:hypothetical protein
MKYLRVMGKWILGLILLCVLLSVLASLRFGAVDFPKPEPIRVIFQDE